MRSGLQRVVALALGAVAAAGIATGCGIGEEDDLIAGKELFVQKCGSCHVLNRAGTTGVQGPSLDAAFGPARSDGLGEGTVAGVVFNQIGNVRRSSTMPADLVSGQDARDVAAYVAAVAGQGGEDRGQLASAGAPEVSNKPIAAEGGTLEMPADKTGALAFASTKATAMAGPLKLVSVNESQVQHNIALRDEAGKLLDEGPVVAGGETSEASGTVAAGKYAFVCTVPGHEEGGMIGELTVK